MSVVRLGDWRILLIRGVAALAFGLAILLWPGLTVAVFVVLFGAFVLIDGIATLALVLTTPPGRSGRRRRVLILEGVAGILIGAITIGWPGITALALLWLIAIWAIVTGILVIRAATRRRRGTRFDWALGVVGALSVVFGAFLLITPGAGALVITWVIGWFAVLYGVLLCVVGWRVRHLDRGVDQAPRPEI